MTEILDERFEETKDRHAYYSQVDPTDVSWVARNRAGQAKQFKRVLDNQAALLLLEKMITEFKEGMEEKAKEIVAFAEQHDILYITGMGNHYAWDDTSRVIDCEDPIGTAIHWAASNHSC